MGRTYGVSCSFTELEYKTDIGPPLAVGVVFRGTAPQPGKTVEFCIWEHAHAHAGHHKMLAAGIDRLIDCDAAVAATPCK